MPKLCESFVFATWNVRTLLDSDSSERPERRTALIAHELDRLSVDIAALSETRFLDEGSLTDGNYTFYWKGLPSGSRKLHGVGFAIKNSIVSRLHELPHGISERLMSLKYQLPDKSFVNVISAYAPTLDADQHLKDAFYDQLESTLRQIPNNHRVVLLGDFNARVGRQAELWPGVVGSNGIGNINLNGELLLSKCAEHDLTITNTQFRQRNKYKGTWRHPRSGHWHLIDYVIVRRKHLNEVRITKSIPNIECWTDHRLVISKMRVNLKPRYQERQRQQARPRIQTERLQIPEVLHQLRRDVETRLSSATPNIQTDPETYWSYLKDAIYESSVSTVGTITKKRQNDWFNDNSQLIKDILDKKHNLFQAVQNNPDNRIAQENFSAIKQSTRRELRAIKNSWWSEKARQIQNYADRHDQRNFFQAIKEIYGVIQRRTCPIKDANGNLLQSESDIRSRWREHYSSVLNLDNEVDFGAIRLIPQYQTATHLDQEISTEEIQIAISDLKNNKSPGCDGIPAEIFKALLDETLDDLKIFFNLIWREGIVPQDFRDAFIVNLFKNKGSASDCGNYRGISLLSIGGKILTKIMASRLLKYIESIIPESQSGFRPKRGTIDLIFTLRQLQEKVREQQSKMFIAFIDLTKAFDSINREALWKIMERFGIPGKFMRVCKSLHENNWARVIHNGEPTDPFLTQTGVRQGCVLAPTLFNIYVAALAIMVDSKLMERGLALRYRFDGGLFNLKRLRAKARIKHVTDLQYADDCALLSVSADKLQEILETYSWAYDALGLKVNINKTKIMTTPHEVQQSDVFVSNEPVEYVNQFNYLGSIVNNKGNIDAEIQNRINAASRAFWKLRDRVFDNHDLTIKTKIAVYRAVVIPTLTYGCETWVPYRRHIQALERFQQRQLRQIMHVKWFHKVSNTDIRRRSNCQSIEDLVSQSRLRWAGHISRMPENRLPKCVLYGELAHGQRKQGGQLKRYKDVLHGTLKHIQIQSNWETLAADRPEWRRITTSYNSAGKPRRPWRNPPAQGYYDCPECGRIISSQIGLFSHRRTHRR